MHRKPILFVAAMILSVGALISGLNFWKADATALRNHPLPFELLQQGRTYTTNADFAEGVLTGVEYTSTANQLQLSSEGGIPPYIWVPNHGEGSISKIDTRDGMEKARYNTGGGSSNPSRTTVDLQGNAWVANRNFATVVKIALAESDCEDRNSNGVIETSRDLNGDGNITGAELLTWGNDECVLKEVVLAAGKVGTYTPGAFTNYSNYGDSGARGLAIDGNGNVWAGVWQDLKYFNINSATGAVIGGSIDTTPQDHRPYGAVIDRYGNLWSASWSYNHVVKINTATRAVTKITLPHMSYGLGLDQNDHLFVSGFSHAKISRLNIITNAIERTVDGEGNLRGVVVTDDGDVWVASSASGRVSRWSNDLLTQRTTPIDVGGSEPAGVAVDQAGKVWATLRNNGTIRRINPATNAVDLTKAVVNTSGHYGYSDMTGKVARTVTTRTGTWTVAHDSGASGTPWGVINWNGAEPAGSSIRARVRSSANQQTWSNWEQVTRGAALSATPANRYIQIEVTLQITTGSSSPILYDLTVTPGSGGGGGDCTYNVAPVTQSFAAAGGNGTVSVTAGSGCTWSAGSISSWITINTGAVGDGNGTVNYSVAANTGASSRVGGLAVAGRYVTIVQAGSGSGCAITPLTIPQTVNGALSTSDCRSNFDSNAYADLYSFTGQAGQSVAISLASSSFDTYLILIGPDGSPLAGNDDDVGSNSRIPPGADFFILPMSGTYIIDASSFFSNQTGNYTLSLTTTTVPGNCTYTLTPASFSFTAAGGNGTLNVNTPTDCGWTANQTVSWITLNSGSSGDGSGAVNFTVEANTSLGFRITRLVVAGQFIPIIQSGTGGDCPITPLTIPQTVNAAWSVGDCANGSGEFTDLYSFTGQAGQRVSIDLTTSSGFTSLYLYGPAGSPVSGYQGTGNLRIPPGSGFFVLPIGGTYIIEAASGVQTNYTLILNGPTATPTCSYALAPSGQSFGVAGGIGAVSMTTQSGCNWTATSNTTWITVTSGASGIGSGVVGYRVAINGGADRTGTLTIGGQTFTVTQAGAGGALTLLEHVVSAGPISTTSCTSPPPRSNFAVTESQVYHWFYVLNSQVGDLVRWEFVQPNGTVFSTANSTTNFAGGVCTWAWINIAGQPAASLPGAWQVRFYWNGVLLGTDNFTLLAVNTCPTVSSISPIIGAPGGTVTITGTNFTGVTAVKFSNNVTAQFTVNSATQITATVPAGAATGPIALSKAGCTEVQSSSFTVTTTTTPCTNVSNLLSNPGAEAGPGNSSTIPSWTTTSNFEVLIYGEVGGPAISESQRINGGNNYFAGGPNTALSTATQTVSVSSQAAEIDTGQLTAKLEAQMAGFSSQGDNGTVRAEFLSAANAVLGSISIGPVGATNSVFQLKTATGTVPSGTRSVRVTMTAVRTEGSYNDAYIDNLVFGLCQGGGGGGDCVQPPAGMVAWLPGDDNANDLTGNHNGTLQNGATYASGAKVGQAFSLDGVDDYVNLGTWSPGTQWTLEAWVSAASVPATRRAILGGMNDCNDWALVLQDGKWGVAIKPASGACTATISSEVTPALGAWYHLAATSDGATARIYVNGELKGSGAVAAGATGTAAGTRIGGNVCCTEFFPGLVDEATIYNRALSLAEIQSVFNADSAGKCKTTSVCTPVTGLNVNRICNPDAELGPGGAAKSDVVPIPGWTTTSNFTATRYDASGGLTVDEGAAIGGGTNYFYGGDTNGGSTAVQLVNVADEAAGIDAGQRTIQLRAHLAGFNGDNAAVRAEFLNAGGAAIGTPLTLGPFSGDPQLFTTSGQVPANTRTIRLTLTSMRVGGQDNEGYFDNISLMLTQGGGGGDCPTITGISPTTGTVASTVTITGTNFSGVTAVRFTNNISAQFTVNSATQITATVPAGAATGPITIVKAGCNNVQTTSFTVTSTGPCIDVSISTGLTAASGASLTVPITVTDTTGKGALAYDATITFDPAVLRLQNPPTDKAGTLSSAYTITTNSPVAGQVRISGFGTAPLAGAGTLLNLRFDLIGAAQACSNIVFTSFRFNEGTPCSTTSNGRACVVGGGIISGAVSYCITPKPVPGAVINVSGSATASTTTDNVGNYRLPTLNSGNYTLTPTKTGDSSGIASFDAALVAQHVVGLTTLTQCQQLAGDTSNNGELSSFDAALIAQFVVGISNPASIAGTWKFVPPTRSYASLSNDQTGQNFEAVLVGDVSGNWASTGLLPETGAPPVVASINAPDQTVQVGLPELTAAAGSGLTIPITVSDLSGRGVIAYDFDLLYNSGVLQAQMDPTDVSGTLSSTFTITSNATPGRLRVSAFGTAPLSGSGILLKLRFNVTGAAGSSTDLTWQQFQFNEGNPFTTTVNGRVNVQDTLTLSLSPAAQTIPVGGSGSLTLVLSQAQAGSVNVNLTSSNPAVASVSASVAIAAGQTITTFEVTGNTVGGPVTITAAASAAPGAPMAAAQVTVVRPVTCVSAASYSPAGLTSESIVAAFGTQLATTTMGATAVPLPTTLAGTTVRIRDSMGVERLAPLFFVSPLQINLQIPSGTANGLANVTVNSGDGTVSTGQMLIVRVAPGLFAANADGAGVPAAFLIRVKPGGAQSQEELLQLDATNRYVPLLIDFGPEEDQLYIILFGTGWRFRSDLAAVSLRIGGLSVPVLFAGDQGFLVGLDQLNALLPRQLAGRGEVNIELVVDGVVANTLRINFK